MAERARVAAAGLAPLPRKDKDAALRAMADALVEHADRVLADAADTHARGQGFLVAVVEHVPTGTLVAFSEVRHPRARPAVVLQGDTLVLREHRGHGLGMLAKLAVLDALAATRPDAERIHTWNAQENDHMLAINVALGFRQASVDAEWQRDL